MPYHAFRFASENDARTGAPSRTRGAPYLRTAPSTRRSLAGLAMVELLVAMAVGLFLMGGIIQVMVSSKASYRLGEAEARVQENGRFALQMLAADLRGARSTGCRSIPFEEAQESINVVACSLLDPSDSETGCVGRPAIGSDRPLGYAPSQRGTADWLAGLPGNRTTGAQAKAASQWLRGDVLVAWGISGGEAYAGPRPDPADAVLERPVELITPNRDLVGGRLALITDCEASDVFTITSPTRCGGTERDPPDSLEHDRFFDPDGGSEDCDGGAAAGQVNSSAALARAYNRIGTATSPGTRLRARTFPFEYGVFYVCCTDSKEGTIQERSAVNNCSTKPERYRPALCRWSTRSGAQQLVSDVADMRVVYDGYVDGQGSERFLDLAGAVPDAAWVSARGYWDRVDSARIQLLATTGEEVRTEAALPNPGATALPDLGYGLPADRRMYQTFDVTTAIRSNALWYRQP